MSLWRIKSKDVAPRAPPLQKTSSSFRRVPEFNERRVQFANFRVWVIPTPLPFPSVVIRLYAKKKEIRGEFRYCFSFDMTLRWGVFLRYYNVCGKTVYFRFIGTTGEMYTIPGGIFSLFYKPRGREYSTADVLLRQEILYIARVFGL